ncbi:MAG: polyheme membrane-associated cytochrome C, partial [Anaerolineae bacterium]|nr:polyheme membrane-associated cytochrome C [Anaerolineae bacterium]
ETCAACHDQDEAEAIRGNLVSDVTAPDYDGDGDTAEGVKAELDALADVLYAELQAYSTDAGAPVVYDSHAYPYFFADTNGDGEATPDEANYGNKYGAFDAKSLKAAYNYQYYQKDPGAFVHNGNFVAQILIDSIADLGGNISAYARP